MTETLSMKATPVHFMPILLRLSAYENFSGLPETGSGRNSVWFASIWLKRWYVFLKIMHCGSVPNAQLAYG